MLFEVFPLSGLQVEPCVGEGADMGQKCFNERMKLILGETERRIHNCRAAGGACTSVCGLEVCVSVGARGRERRRELGEGGGKKNQACFLHSHFQLGSTAAASALAAPRAEL